MIKLLLWTFADGFAFSFKFTFPRRIIFSNIDAAITAEQTNAVNDKLYIYYYYCDLGCGGNGVLGVHHNIVIFA